MDFGIKDNVIAIIAREENALSAATVPVFYAKTEQQQETIAFYLSKVTTGMVHDLGNGCYVVVKH
ncbi:capping complex subunit for YIEGIA [Geosporobacter ferrireducens]|uniref:Uncharacterized protein n=1 Tax=Geosporobacter ferrireducens TaxID=1424294 RepID=A0A1D8GC04_9FIRM|nr:hypothetical protein [Geosporobacter ferrireducens]AOT68445.1 hypothetical protein Gferi_01860 [Geosporobacter ferrireducens]MTI53901.1 hypothetical protein [Geosporobacter ferrireducens]